MQLVGTVTIFSVMTQLTTAVIALRLIGVTKKRAAWGFLAAAFTLMGLRRLESLVKILSADPSYNPDLLFEAIGLALSVLMLIGVWLIRPIFLSLARSEEEQRALNAKLITFSEEQQLLLESAKDFIYRHDPQGMISYVSPAVRRITGFSPQEWLAHFSKHYTGNPLNQDALAVNTDMLTGGEPRPYIVEVFHKNGGTVWLEVNKQPYHRDGRLAGFIGVARDITSRVHLEGERENLIAELQQALNNIKTLKGLLPICSSCKKVRDDKGYWNQIEAYVSEHSGAEFTHGICPDCARRLYSDYLPFSQADGKQ